MVKTKHSTIFYVILVVVAIIYLATGLIKLFNVETTISDFESWGYAPVFMYLLGVAELAGAIGLFVPKTRIPAMAGLSVVMMGAIGTHIINGEYLPMLLPLVLLLLLIALFAMSRKEIEEANLKEHDQVNY